MQLLFALTLLVSATLLFLIEPMFAKMVLPRLGGSPAVWNTCMVFYQAVLLAGYLYAHLTIRWLGVRRQAAFHVLVLLLPLMVLPIMVRDAWTPATSSVHPIAVLLLLLSLSVGLPFLVVSASAPMLQSWFSETGHPAAKDPYFLYAASNLGSMVALLGYPLLIEPTLRLAQQSWTWTAGYGLLVLLTAACAVILWRSPRPAEATAATEPEEGESGGVTLGRRMRWLALSFVPSSMLLGVTTYISTDIAAVPLVWVIPLVLYLLTFVLVFARRRLLPHPAMLVVQPFLLVFVAAAYYQWASGWTAARFGLHLAVFFVTAMVCHGELAADRPAARRLTEFYLWMSLGGVLGGLFNALLAPLVFPTVVEYPLVIVAACLVRPLTRRLTATIPWFLHPSLLATVVMLAAVLAQARNVHIVAGLSIEVWILAAAGLAAFGLSDRPRWFGSALACVFLIGLFFSGKSQGVLHLERSFFGVFRIAQELKSNRVTLFHGSTIHGIQSRDPKLRLVPASYYHRSGPLGQILASRSDAHKRHLAVVGLGTGTIAAYGTPGQEITFYEIDPAVERLARDTRFFTYLSDSKATIRVVLGDARLSLVHAANHYYDVIVLDAFTSDAIPLHLMTRESLALYLRKLAPGGVLALHISNRHMDLAPVLGRLAEDAQATALIGSDRSRDITKAQRREGKFSSTWVVLARKPEDLGGLLDDTRWEDIEVPKGTPLWTDDFSNILSVLWK